MSLLLNFIHTFPSIYKSKGLLYLLYDDWLRVRREQIGNREILRYSFCTFFMKIVQHISTILILLPDEKHYKSVTVIEWYLFLNENHQIYNNIFYWFTWNLNNLSIICKSFHHIHCEYIKSYVISNVLMVEMEVNIECFEHVMLVKLYEFKESFLLELINFYIIWEKVNLRKCDISKRLWLFICLIIFLDSNINHEMWTPFKSGL